LINKRRLKTVHQLLLCSLHAGSLWEGTEFSINYREDTQNSTTAVQHRQPSHCCKLWLLNALYQPCHSQRRLT